MNAEIAQFEALGKELLRRCMAEEEPEELRRWLSDTLNRMGGADTSAVLPWRESLFLVDTLIEEYEARANMPADQRKELTWPWETWRKLIDPLEEGMLGLITAPDGQGKTIYGESIAEYWAQHKNKVVFVHYELNRRLMMLRRTARHTGITVRAIKEGKLTANQRAQIQALNPAMQEWDGCITYLHTPGWTMERTIAELTRLRNEGLCDAVVLDYLEKAFPSARQLKMYGSNPYQREADNVEQLKTFSESSGVPTLMIAQMSKDGKRDEAAKMDRNGITGSAEKSNKANLVVLIKRPRTEEGYSPMVDVVVDKNTMGGTGQFKQYMQPEYFRVGDMNQTSDASRQPSAQSPRGAR